MQIMAKLIAEYDHIPTWAIYALEYGVNESQDLTDEDIALINRFLKNFPNGYYMEVDWESQNEFDTIPDFGPACSTVKCKFYL